MEGPMKSRRAWCGTRQGGTVGDQFVNGGGGFWPESIKNVTDADRRFHRFQSAGFSGTRQRMLLWARMWQGLGGFDGVALLSS